MNNIRAETIGSIAYGSLAEGQQGSVFGRTSRGIFIRTASKFLIFLSFERYRGPLTVNLSTDGGSISRISAGMEVEISTANLYLPDPGLKISLEQAEVWVPPDPASHLARRDNRLARLASLTQRIVESKVDSGLSSLLPYLLEMDDLSGISESALPNLNNKILQLQQQIKSMHNLPRASAMVGLLGSGPGLTPSGDDFILGMLLTFNRLRDLFPQLQDLETFNRQIIEAAYRKTTRLSANLIECATLGLGNERLIDTLEWIINGSNDEEFPVDHLLSWGHSSGIDAFVGYVVALSISFSDFNRNNGSLE